jgi:hypothetical protein
MSEVVRQLPPSVRVDEGVRGVILTTDEITRHEEAFVDTLHLNRETRYRGRRHRLRVFGAIGAGIASVVLAGAGALSLAGDLINHRPSDIRQDAETLLLGAAGAGASTLYGKRKYKDIVIGLAQAKAAKGAITRINTKK